jgi:hypothetical protein
MKNAIITAFGIFSLLLLANSTSQAHSVSRIVGIKGSEDIFDDSGNFVDTIDHCWVDITDENGNSETMTGPAQCDYWECGDFWSC